MGGGWVATEVSHALGGAHATFPSDSSPKCAPTPKTLYKGNQITKLPPQSHLSSSQLSYPQTQPLQPPTYLSLPQASLHTSRFQVRGKSSTNRNSTYSLQNQVKRSSHGLCVPFFSSSRGPAGVAPTRVFDRLASCNLCPFLLHLTPLPTSGTNAGITVSIFIASEQ